MIRRRENKIEFVLRRSLDPAIEDNEYCLYVNGRQTAIHVQAGHGYYSAWRENDGEMLGGVYRQTLACAQDDALAMLRHGGF